MTTQLEQRTGFPYWLTTSTFDGRVEETFGKSLPRLGAGAILDFGCSEGRTTEEIQKLYPLAHVTGMDINPGQIKKAIEKRRKGKFILADGYSAYFPDESFDLVFCMNNIGFAIGLEDEVECRRVLSPITPLIRQKGHLLVSNIDSYVILQKNERGFRLKNYENIHSDISPLAMIAYILSSERPRVVPMVTPKKSNSNNPLEINDYLDNSVRLPDYLKKSRERILNENNFEVRR